MVHDIVRSRPRLDNLEAETKVRGVWTRISIDDALRASGQVFRCIACHGRMSAHKRSKKNGRQHFEHRALHGGCPRGSGFTGFRSPHPDALE